MTTTIDTAPAAAADLVRAVASTSPTDPCRDELRARAIAAWLPLAHRLARRYAWGREELDDLRQTATVGLIKAIDSFDLRWGDDFVALAVPTVAGEIKRHFRDRCWTIRPPRRLHDAYLRIRESVPRLTQQLGHPPTTADVARDLGLTVEEVLEGLECAHARRAASLSGPVYGESGVALGEVLPDGADEYHDAELRLDLHRALAQIDERAQRVLTLYFYGNQSQAEIARQLGLSQMHISRVLRAALAELRERIGGDRARET